MQSSRTFLVVCAVACFTSSIAFAAPDNLSQAQAREALRKKMDELNAQQPATETPAPMTKPAKAPKPVAAPKPVKKPEPVVVAQPPAVATPAPTAVAPTSPAPLPRATGEQVARQREALRQKMAELEAQGKAGQPASASVAAPAVVSAPPSTTPSTAMPVAKPTAAKSANTKKAEKQAAAAEKKRAAAEAKAREDDQKAAAAEAKARQAKKGKTKPELATETKPAALAPFEPPPSSVLGAKEIRLNELLSKYKAEAITPEEYHKERAKILAEP